MGATAGVDGVPSTPTQDLRKVAVAMKIVAGLDLGSESISLWTMDQAGHRLGGGKTDWDEKVWKQWVKKYGAENLEVAFETGPEGYRADWMLKELGVKTYPFHAGHFGEISRSRKKTDKIDAEKICRALRGGALPRRVELPGPGQARPGGASLQAGGGSLTLTGDHGFVGDPEFQRGLADDGGADRARPRRCSFGGRGPAG